MDLYRWTMLGVSAVSFTLFGYDRVAAEWHKVELKKDLHARVTANTPGSQWLDPLERVRRGLRAESEAARRRGEAYSWKIGQAAGRIDIDVTADYHTKVSRYVGMETLPSSFSTFFTVGGPPGT